MALAAATAATPSTLHAQEPPRFTSAVEVLSVDVTVLDRSGLPVADLLPEDFSVRVDGAQRHLISAEWVPLVVPETSSPPQAPPGYSSNEGTTTGRLILIVVDQPNIRFGATVPLRRSLEAFVGSLQSTDRVAVIALGPGGGAFSTSFTADREAIRTAVSGMNGTAEPLMDWQHNISVSEAVDIYRANIITLGEVVRRECSIFVGFEFNVCSTSVEQVAYTMARQIVSAGRDTYYALESLLESLSVIDAPKTLLFITEGFILEEGQAALEYLGRLAQRSRTAIYGLKLDEEMGDIAVRDRPFSPQTDRRVRAADLEHLTNAARGSLFYAVGDASGALSRIEAELAGYYLLAVESAPSDSDGRRHRIDVSVARRDTTVRWRREMSLDPGGLTAPTPQQQAISALNSPLMLSAMPLRVASFSLPDPDPSRVQVLLHAAVGSGYTGATPMALAYTIADRAGRILESHATTGVLSPVMNAVPSPLQFRASASLPPGDYRLRFAVADGERVGTVEHPVEARLMPAGDVRLSELVLGGPVISRQPLQPSIGHVVNFGLLHGYLEAAGERSGDLRVRYEVVPQDGGEALLSADVEPYRTGERAIFAHVMQVQRLPDGEYVLRATVRDDRDQPISTLSRTFEVSPPPVLMAPAAGGGGSLAAGPPEIFLPVDETRLRRPFDSRDVGRHEVLQAFRERVSRSALAAFDQGVTELERGDYPRAERSFKSAIQIDADSTSAIAYLAATFAAAGQDQQAAGAWQTALIDGSDLAQIYLWLGDALIRTRDMAQARSILEEAASKWPADTRFAKPLAIVYATFGLGREAVRSILRHLETEPSDREALAMAVEWIYHLRLAGAVARSEEEDVRRAREYAEAYERLKGPESALVRQWVSAIEAAR